MSTVLAPQSQQLQEHFVPQVNNNTYYYNEQTKKHYFKVFLMNNRFNKRKFRVSNLNNLNKDIDGYENLPVTFVGEGIRKGNHPNPKDANIFEANYQNRYSYVTKAIDYYKTFGIAKIVKIYKPDPNMLTASSVNPDSSNILNYFALCETEHPKMIEMLQQAKGEDKRIFVSPAMFSWDWNKDPNTGHVDVNSFVPTHLAIVDSPAYDPEIAYIKKQTCSKDGVSCYHELFEASDIENLNNDNPKTNNMSSNKFPSTLEEYVKSYYGYDVVDAKSINAEELVKNLGNLIIIDKEKVLKNTKPTEATPIPPAKPNEVVATSEPHKGEPAAAVPASKKEEQQAETETPKKESKEPKSNFTIEDVKALLAEQKQSILSELKAEKTKGERDQLLDTYLQNEKIKAVKDKINLDQLNKTRELYNSLGLDNEQLKTVLDNSIYNPKVANPDLYKVLLAVETKTEEQSNTENKNETISKPTGAPKDPAVPKLNTSSNPKPITDVPPPKPNTNINMFGTEFKSSADNTNKYNDEFKGKGNGKDFNASKSDNEYHPIPTTGEGVPKRFQKYIQ